MMGTSTAEDARGFWNGTGTGFSIRLCAALAAGNASYFLAL